MTMRLLPNDRYVCSDIEPLHLHSLCNLFCRRPNVKVKKLDISSNIAHWESREKFDTVTGLNVLEHMEDHENALANMNRLLISGGRMILLVPNCPSLFSSLDVALGHIRRYRKKEIKNLVENAGFELERIWEFNRVSFPGWIWNGKLRHRRTFPRLQLKIFDSLVWIWKLIDPYLSWPGQSIIIVAKKLK